MKRCMLAALLSALLLVLSSCHIASPFQNPSQPDTDAFVSETQTVTAEFSEPAATEIVPNETESVNNTTLEQQEPSLTVPQESITQAQAHEEQTTVQTVLSEETTVVLDINIPSASGKMSVDASADNPLTRTVAEKRGISAELLCAVFCETDQSQNYVFEFCTNDRTDKDNIRRVYLLDANGAIKSVAAAKNEEKENLSATENWFCMNVLIKGVIFPAISEDIPG